MKYRKILYIASYYDVKNNSAAIRNNSMVKGLTECGCEVDVETVEWGEGSLSDYFRKENNGRIRYSSLGTIGLNVSLKQKISVKQNKWVTWLKKKMKEIYFFPDICYPWKDKIDVRRYGEYDLLISSSDLKSSHYAARKIKAAYPDLPWIQIWGDPWADDVNVSFYLRPLIRRMESRLLQKADKVVYVSEPTAVRMKKRYAKLASKLAFVPRGYYTEAGQPGKKREGEPYQLVYTGIISYGRNISALLTALEAYNRQATVPVQLHLYGSFPAELSAEVKRFGCVVLHGVADYAKMPAVLGRADGLLYLSNRKGSTQIPGKLYDYMGGRCPVYCLVYDTEDAVSVFLKSFDRCLLVENKPEEIEKSLPHLVACMKKEYIPDPDYSPRHIAGRVLNLL